MKEGWIVVFDLDDTLVTNVENKPQLLDDTIVVLQKALEKRVLRLTVFYYIHIIPIKTIL